MPMLLHALDKITTTPVRAQVRAGQRVDMTLVRAVEIYRGARPHSKHGGRADDEGSASRRRVRACGFSSPVAPGTWAGTSSAS